MRWLQSLDIGVIYDIGAHIGRWSKKARKLFPEAHIVAFEPVLGCYKELVKAGGADKRFWPFPFAISDESGTTEFHINNLTVASSMLAMEELHVCCWPESDVFVTDRVMCRSLDDIATYMAFPGGIMVKIDVQGVEDKVIKGGIKTLERTSVVICETSFFKLYKNQCLFDDIYGLLKDLGFTYIGAVGKALQNPHDDINLEEDSIFVRLNGTNP